MSPALDLLARLQSKGVALRADGPDLVVRPADAVSPADVAALRAHKGELLALLRSASEPWVALRPAAVREALGPQPDEHALASLRFDVLAAVCRLRAEVAEGHLGSTLLRVRGQPLGDWLELDDVARLLRAWRDHPRRP